jgi:hypothetical protein
MGKSTISMAIFNSYVKLPEGRMILQWQWLWDETTGLLPRNVGIFPEIKA